MAHFDDDIRRHFAFVVRLMNAQDLNGLTSHLAVPFIAYVLEEIVVMETWPDVVKATRLRMENVMADPCKEAVGRIVEITHDAEDRATVLFQWDFLRDTGAVHHSDLIRYMVTRSGRPSGLTVEMVEYLWISDRTVSDDVLDTLRRKEPAWKGIH
ncbi:hypothetical protein [Sulfitobacter sp. JB4-11]|uniref:hypothetical protein n=1 Tax=Sulfitobacter rhodophyticola TaxID=3238304 RepID=UPI0035129DA2